MTGLRLAFEPRPLNADERRVLDLLLTQDFAGAPELRAQVDHAQVIGGCSCGCASVDLEVDRADCECATDARSPIPSEAQVVDNAGDPQGGALVFLKDGYLASLEIYSYADPIPSWPASDRLQLDLVER